MDCLTPEQRHKNMVNIKSKDTSIEVVLRKALWKKGIRYRKNYKLLPGTPDIAKNREHDDEVNKKLLFMGWTVVRFWGNDIKKKTDECIKVIEETIFDMLICDEGMQDS